jgi:hypothetical protein
MQYVYCIHIYVFYVHNYTKNLTRLVNSARYVLKRVHEHNTNILDEDHERLGLTFDWHSHEGHSRVSITNADRKAMTFQYTRCQKYIYQLYFIHVKGKVKPSM